jgi:CheY-like chemotaxis protein
VEGGELKLQSIAFSLSKLAWKVIRLVESEAKDKLLGLFVEIDERIPGTVLGDPERIQQVLLNLLRNAIKFTENGEVTLSLIFDRADEKSSTIRFKVTDTGIGIAKEDHEKIFLPFTQRDSSLHRQYDGIGMGLAISKKLLEKMGSSLYLESNEGEGSVFSFNLSFSNTSSAESPPSDANSHLGSLEKSFAGRFPVRIMVVDDNLTNINLLMSLLRRLGYENIVKAMDGKEALALFPKQKSEVIFMDLQMSGLDGISTTRAIRKMETNDPGKEPCRIIALTGNVDPQTRSRCFEEGMDDYISKPFNTLFLAESIAARFMNQLIRSRKGQ